MELDTYGNINESIVVEKGWLAFKKESQPSFIINY